MVLSTISPISPLYLHYISPVSPQVRGQMVLSTGMYAIAFASQLCDRVHIYGFGNGSCPHQACMPFVTTTYLSLDGLAAI